MDPDGTRSLILLVVLIFVRAFFSMSETAIITLNDNQLKKMADSGNKKAKLLVKMTGEPSRFLSASQACVTLTGLATAAIMAVHFAPRLQTWMAPTNLPDYLLHGLSILLIILISAFFLLVFGIFVPKRIGMHHAQGIAFATVTPLRILFAIIRPFVFLLVVTSNGVLRICGINPHQHPEQVTEEEIRMMVDVGEEKGVIEQSDKDMINNIFEFDDRTAEEVMTHRTDMVAVESTDSITDVVHLSIENGYSRIPVYERDIDNIIGVIHVKDLLVLVEQDPEDQPKDVRPFLRPVLYVPENSKCKDLFRIFQEKRAQIAIVCDEYGGTSGIVTMEDLLESIVGNIQDEYDNEEEEFSLLSENLYMVDGSASVEDVEHQLHLQLPNGEEFDTISGLITDALDRIPEQGEHPVVTFPGVEFTVLHVEDRHIDRLQARLIPSPLKQED